VQTCLTLLCATDDLPYAFQFTLTSPARQAFFSKCENDYADQHCSIKRRHGEDFSTLYRESDDALCRRFDLVLTFLALLQQFIYSAKYSTARSVMHATTRTSAIDYVSCISFVFKLNRDAAKLIESAYIAISGNPQA